MLAKSSAQPSPAKINKIVKSSEELNQLKEENRMVRFAYSAFAIWKCAVQDLICLLSANLRNLHVIVIAHGGHGRVAGTSRRIRE